MCRDPGANTLRMRSTLMTSTLSGAIRRPTTARERPSRAGSRIRIVSRR
jgi:hypothetical protein